MDPYGIRHSTLGDIVRQCGSRVSVHTRVRVCVSTCVRWVVCSRVGVLQRCVGVGGRGGGLWAAERGDGWTDGWTHRWTDGYLCRWMDERMNESMDGRTDEYICRWMDGHADTSNRLLIHTKGLTSGCAYDGSGSGHHGLAKL